MVIIKQCLSLIGIMEQRQKIIHKHPGGKQKLGKQLNVYHLKNYFGQSKQCIHKTHRNPHAKQVNRLTFKTTMPQYKTQEVWLTLCRTFGCFLVVFCLSTICPMWSAAPAFLTNEAKSWPPRFLSWITCYKWI